MKLLIITSELLNPEHIVNSTFELTQAKILRKLGEVSILSVSPHDSLSAAIKYSISKGRHSEGTLKRVKRIFSKLLFGRFMVNNYTIEGIPVFEGNDFRWISSSDYSNNLKSWVSAGLTAYESLKKKYGRPDIVHAHGRFLNAGILAKEINKKEGIPYVYTDHSTFYQLGIAPLEAKPVLDEVLKHASVVTTVSQGLLSQMEKFLDRKIPDAVIFPNVLDLIYESEMLPKATTTKPFKFISIASLHKKKGLDILLRAFKLAFDGKDDYHLTICGDGPLLNDLLQLRKELDLLGSVSFKGSLAKHLILEELNNANVLVVASLEETFGVVIIEALSRGCPVIATRSGGPEFILPSQFGLLIEKNNSEELGNALKCIVNEYGNFNREKMHEYAISRFGSLNFISESKKIYNDVLNRAN